MDGSYDIIISLRTAGRQIWVSDLSQGWPHSHCGEEAVDTWIQEVQDSRVSIPDGSRDIRFCPWDLGPLKTK